MFVQRNPVAIEREHNALMQAAWTALAAARDLDDVATQLIARVVIDDLLHGRRPRMGDVDIINRYF